eukprot:596175-Rhodomonas_salina.3
MFGVFSGQVLQPSYPSTYALRHPRYCHSALLRGVRYGATRRADPTPSRGELRTHMHKAAPKSRATIHAFFCGTRCVTGVTRGYGAISFRVGVLEKNKPLQIFQVVVCSEGSVIESQCVQCWYAASCIPHATYQIHRPASNTGFGSGLRVHAVLLQHA